MDKKRGFTIALKEVLFTDALSEVLENIRRQHGDNALVSIRADDKGVTIKDVVTGKMLYDADTLPEFTYRYYTPKDG